MMDLMHMRQKKNIIIKCFLAFIGGRDDIINIYWGLRII